MDLIYTNADLVDQGVLQDCMLDLAFGADENDFELEVPAEGVTLEAGALLYIEGTEYGGMDTMPDIVGLGLWKKGHWGVYVGNGYAIEAMGTQYGVVRTKVEGRGWQGWCKI